jgi:hypothetical protein
MDFIHLFERNVAFFSLDEVMINLERRCVKCDVSEVIVAWKITKNCNIFYPFN